MTIHADLVDAAASARLGAAGLALGRSIDLWSLALTVLALACLSWTPFHPLMILPQVFLMLSVLAGGLQKILALRVAFDEAIFRQWASIWNRTTEPDSAINDQLASLAEFDRALANCGLRVAPEGVPRNLDSRLRGAMKLFRWQMFTFVMQFSTWVGVIAALYLSSPG
jgi:hypothetical protein